MAIKPHSDRLIAIYGDTGQFVIIGELKEFFPVSRHKIRFMKITAQLTDESVLKELGVRLAGARLARNMTQAALAEQAGVSKRTLERLESGAVAPQLSGFLRICRALGLMENFDNLIPDVAVSPMEQLKQKGKMRQRAKGRGTAPGDGKKWTWGDES